MLELMHKIVKQLVTMCQTI